jgi:hypothetical protein
MPWGGRNKNIGLEKGAKSTRTNPCPWPKDEMSIYAEQKPRMGTDGHGYKGEEVDFWKSNRAH